MILQVKNMVCKRCIMVVGQQLDVLNLPYSDLQLGAVTLSKEAVPETLVQLDALLRTFGFELIDERKARITEKIKNAVVQLVHYSGEVPKQNLSVYLSELLHYEYKYLSNLFSESEGITIEHYMISQKTARAKELIRYGELSLSDIADKLGYSSVAYFSSQFRKMTGLTPGAFKHSMRQRQPIEEL